MIKKMKRKILTLLIVILGGLGGISRSEAALTCPGVHSHFGSGVPSSVDTTWCDADQTRFTNDFLCLVEPVDSPSSIDEEVAGVGACVLGKLKTLADRQRVVDLAISYDFVGIPRPGEDPFSFPSGVVIPDLSQLTSEAEFLSILPLDRDGPYDLSVNYTLLGSDGVPQTPFSISRRILRIGTPNLTVTAGRVGELTASSCTPGDMENCIAVQEITGDSDGDGVCDGQDEIPGLCAAGPDTVDNNGAEGEPHTVKVDLQAAQGKLIQFCLKTPDSTSNVGTAVSIKARNTILDRSVSPEKKTVVKSTDFSSNSFCPDGFLVKVPLGHGSNQIDLQVENLVDDQKVKLLPFDVDLKGPSLCVRYLGNTGQEIADVDGKVLLASEGDSVTVDVALGACGQTPETVTAPATTTACDPKNPPPCGDSPVCLQRNNDADFVALCPTQGHYQAAVSKLRFPINTVTIKAKDDQGNETKETHSFGYGNVRPLFDSQGKFNLDQAMIPNGVGGFLPKGFINGGLKEAILKVVNSDKFKDDIFPKLLDPRQPGNEEIACLNALQSETGCSYSNLASRERVTAIKMFGVDVGTIEIPTIYFLNDNTLQLQLKVNGLHGRAEAYTLQFQDSDNDGVVDTEDDDDDNDGICDNFVGAIGACTDDNHDGVCDEKGGISGHLGSGLKNNKCVLDKTVPRGECPDVKPTDKHYWGCQDLDDDNDGVPDTRDQDGDGKLEETDLPGEVVPDPDFKFVVLPLQFKIKELALNLEVHFQKESDGRLHTTITNIPGRELVEAVPELNKLIDFDCDKNRSETPHGKPVQRPQGPYFDLRPHKQACSSLENVNSTLIQSHSNFLLNQMVSVLDWVGALDPKQRKNQDLNQNLVCTLEATTRCSLPRRLEATLAKFDDDKVIGTSIELLDKRFHVDFFSPLGKADIAANPQGLGLKGSGLLAPAGVSEASDKTERDSKEFLDQLPAEFKNKKFGPLSKPGNGKGQNPINAALEMGSPLNLALNEETINSILHSVGILLWDLADQEGDKHQTLDIDTFRLRNNFKMGSKERGDNVCRDKNDKPIDGAPDNGNNTYKCFPFVLDITEIFGDGRFDYVDFGGDPHEQGKTPLLLRSTINAHSPPTVRLVSVTPIESWDGTGPSRPAIVMIELEIGIGAAPIAIYEKNYREIQRGTETIRRGAEEIKSFCDPDPEHQSTGRPACVAGGDLVPIAKFSTAGRLFVTALLSIDRKGLVQVEAGLSSREKSDGTLELDTSKSYFDVSMLENNTIIPDRDLIVSFQNGVDIIMGKYLFGEAARDIQVKLPAKLPLEAFCGVYEADLCQEKNSLGDPREDLCKVCECVRGTRTGDDCKLADKVQDLWSDLNVDDFGINGVTLVQPLLGISDDGFSPTRYLTIGAGIDFELAKPAVP